MEHRAWAVRSFCLSSPVRAVLEEQSVAENRPGVHIQLGRKFEILQWITSLLLNSLTCFSLEGWCLNCFGQNSVIF